MIPIEIDKVRRRLSNEMNALRSYEELRPIEDPDWLEAKKQARITFEENLINEALNTVAHDDQKLMREIKEMNKPSIDRDYYKKGSVMALLIEIALNMCIVPDEVIKKQTSWADKITAERAYNLSINNENERGKS